MILKIKIKKIKKLFVLIKKIFLLFLFLFLLLIKKNINIMYYFSNNLGDNLNYYLLKDMIDMNINFYNTYIKKPKNKKLLDIYNIKKLNKVAKIDFVFIGSILETICNWSYIFLEENNKYKAIISKFYYKIIDYFYPLIIFGTGFISPQIIKNESYVRNIKIMAVRGNISLQRFNKNGIKASKNVILADPGILAPLLLNFTSRENNNFTKEYDLCIIPHCIDKKSELLIKSIRIDNSIILNIEENPLLFIRNLLKCKNILSSGLHGLIIAASLGIPNMRMVVGDRIIGGNYKFIDYYSAYNLKLPPYIDIRKTNFTYKELDNLKNNHFISEDIIRKKQCALLLKFPFKLTKKYRKIKHEICNKNKN